jgi:hypothetical protein
MGILGVKNLSSGHHEPVMKDLGAPGSSLRIREKGKDKFKTIITLERSFINTTKGHQQELGRSFKW